MTFETKVQPKQWIYTYSLTPKVKTNVPLEKKLIALVFWEICSVCAVIHVTMAATSSEVYCETLKKSS
jgi:hypothetical protein